MGEKDQTKWVGIRPTDPPENIPVTESNPLTHIAVEPRFGTTSFNTNTRKRIPAIADMQALKHVELHSDFFTVVVAGTVHRDLWGPAAGECGMSVGFAGYSSTGATSGFFTYIKRDATYYYFSYTPVGAAWIYSTVHLPCPAEPGDTFGLSWITCAVDEVLTSWFTGYSVPKY